MPRTKAGGARGLQLNDWPFGAVGRRLLLDALLRGKQPKGGWTKRALETHAEVGPGGLDEVLAGALELGLLEQQGARWCRTRPLPPIARPLRTLLRASDNVPETPIAPLPRRAYNRRD
jgi:hypothetical protein